MALLPVKIPRYTSKLNSQEKEVEEFFINYNHCLNEVLCKS